MKFLILLCLLPTLALAQIGGGRSAKYIDFDSSGVAADSAFRYGKFRMWFKLGADGQVHPYFTKGSGATARIDSGNFVDTLYRTAGKDTIFWRKNGTTYSFRDSVGTGGGGSGLRIATKTTRGMSAPDSVIVWLVDTTLTLDSIMVYQAGASALTMNATRTRSAVTVDLLSANQNVTGTLTKATGLQNNSLQKGDLIKVAIRSITGTTTEFFTQFNHR